MSKELPPLIPPNAADRGPTEGWRARWFRLTGKKPISDDGYGVLYKRYLSGSEPLKTMQKKIEYRR